MPKADKLVAYLDTNCFLHFQPFDQVAWEKELSARRVCLRVAPVVVAELDKHKTHPVSHISARARDAISKIRKILGGKLHLRAGIFLECDTVSSLPSTSPLGLSPDRQDDQLIAAILHYKEAHPTDRVVLITDDAGCALRAHGFGIETTELEERFRLPPQPDARQLQVRELESKLKALEVRLPKLQLRFLDAGEVFDVQVEHEQVVTLEAARLHVKHYLEPHSPLTDMERWTRLAAPGALGEDEGPTSAQLRKAVASIGAVIAQERNFKRARYLEQYAQYLLEHWEHVNRMHRTVIIALELTNEGSAPAEDVCVVLQLPGDLDIFPRTIPPPPTVPSAPGQAAGTPGPGIQVFSAPTFRLDKWVRGRTHFYMHFRVARLNQHLSEFPLGLALRFQSHAAVRPIVISYRLTAVNLTEPASGELKINARLKSLPKRKARRALPPRPND